MTAPLLTLQDLSLTFPGRAAPALEGVDLAVRRGETLCLLGPSGCGKSTLLRLVAGLETPTGGAIDWPDNKPEIGFVFQEPNLMPWADVAANVALPLRLAGMGRREAASRVETALERVGLKGLGADSAARTVRRHEDARFAGARAGGWARPAAPRRALRRAGRDHPLGAERRAAKSARRRHHPVRHPFGLRGRLSRRPRLHPERQSRPRPRPGRA